MMASSVRIYTHGMTQGLAYYHRYYQGYCIMHVEKTDTVGHIHVMYQR